MGKQYSGWLQYNVGLYLDPNYRKLSDTDKNVFWGVLLYMRSLTNTTGEIEVEKSLLAPLCGVEISTLECSMLSINRAGFVRYTTEKNGQVLRIKSSYYVDILDDYIQKVIRRQGGKCPDTCPEKRREEKNIVEYKGNGFTVGPERNKRIKTKEDLLA